MKGVLRIFYFFLLLAVVILTTEVPQAFAKNFRFLGNDFLQNEKIEIIEKGKDDSTLTIELNTYELITEDVFVIPFQYQFSSLSINEVWQEVIYVEGHPEDLEISLGEKNEIEIPYVVLSNKNRRLSTGNSKWKTQFLGYFMGRPVTEITFLPMMYDNKEKKVRIYSHVQYLIQMRDKNKTAKIFHPYWFLRRMKEKNRHFLIAIPRGWQKNIQEFVLWKEKLGYFVDVIAIDDNCTYLKNLSSNKYLYFLKLKDSSKSDFCETKNGIKNKMLLHGEIQSKSSTEMEEILEKIIEREKKGNVFNLSMKIEEEDYSYTLTQLDNEKEILGLKESVDQEKKKLVYTRKDFINIPSFLKLFFDKNKEEEAAIITDGYSLSSFLRVKEKFPKIYDREIQLGDIAYLKQFYSIDKKGEKVKIAGDPTLYLGGKNRGEIDVVEDGNVLYLKDYLGHGIEDAKVIVIGPHGKEIFYSDDKGRVEIKMSFSGHKYVIHGSGYSVFESIK